MRTRIKFSRWRSGAAVLPLRAPPASRGLHAELWCLRSWEPSTLLDRHEASCPRQSNLCFDCAQIDPPWTRFLPRRWQIADIHSNLQCLSGPPQPPHGKSTGKSSISSIRHGATKVSVMSPPRNFDSSLSTLSTPAFGVCMISGPTTLSAWKCNFSVPSLTRLWLKSSGVHSIVARPKRAPPFWIFWSCVCKMSNHIFSMREWATTKMTALSGNGTFLVW